MRKLIKDRTHEAPIPSDRMWLDLDRIARVEVSSETADHPIEEALVLRSGRGWKAAGPGAQTILLRFDQPQSIGHLRLIFEEKERARTQEIVLRWSAENGGPLVDILRQQYHFAPSGSILEVEDYRVQLEGVLFLELNIRPDIGGGDAIATLKELSLA